MSSKFGALSKLNTPRPETEESRDQEIEKARNLETERNRNQENSTLKISEIEDPWIALGTEVRRATKRRLKAYAGAHGDKLKELVDQAITSYLDRLET